jgi:hypothetical protein
VLTVQSRESAAALPGSTAVRQRLTDVLNSFQVAVKVFLAVKSITALVEAAASQGRKVSPPLSRPCHEKGPLRLLQGIAKHC